MKKPQDKALGTYDISKICHVAPITVGRWIEEGKLPYFTTGGGHRRVWNRDLVEFLKSHNYPIPKGLSTPTHFQILIVDDDAACRRLIHRSLSKTFSHIKVEEAADGYEAGEKVATLIPALVILDIRLPGVDGFKVCERIRLSKPLKKIKILAISGDGKKETRERILKAGADAFMAKPFDADEMMKIIGRLGAASI